MATLRRDEIGPTLHATSARYRKHRSVRITPWVPPGTTASIACGSWSMYEPSLTVDGMTCALWVERAPQLVHEGLPLGNVGEGGVVVGVGAGDAGGCE